MGEGYRSIGNCYFPVMVMLGDGDNIQIARSANFGPLTETRASFPGA